MAFYGLRPQAFRCPEPSEGGILAIDGLGRMRSCALSLSKGRIFGRIPWPSTGSGCMRPELVEGAGIWPGVLGLRRAPQAA